MLGSNQASMDSTIKAGKVLMDKSENDDAIIIEGRIADLKARWDAVCGLSVERWERYQGWYNLNSVRLNVCIHLVRKFFLKFLNQNWSVLFDQLIEMAQVRNVFGWRWETDFRHFGKGVGLYFYRWSTQGEA